MPYWGQIVRPSLTPRVPYLGHYRVVQRTTNRLRRRFAVL